jgi:hypothetical protein
MPQAAAEYEYLNIVSQTFTTYFGKEEILWNNQPQLCNMKIL